MLFRQCQLFNMSRTILEACSFRRQHFDRCGEMGSLGPDRRDLSMLLMVVDACKHSP
eukprot:m.145001 g.145001  ORF g.145001 m.145001 type:complete len:57 (-) comp52673_c0_seq6:59-229(-)